ncbi:bacterial low temperature requirement A protein-domain-containing protein [Chytriomyces cf. hyalinus JEL632]|nr:bacterial low temperature requirement A protein-domain-containing protein [Chytriomyces cf. hyalinus JEL632]
MLETANTTDTFLVSQTSSKLKESSARLLDAVHTPMVARDPHEKHRAATPLELLFDLTMVVAVAVVSAEFDHYILEGGNIGKGVLRFAFSFLSIWIAWLNYVWFASGYDSDDVLFRLGTLGQMIGVLVLGNGIPNIFRKLEFTQSTYGYAIMRFFHIFFFRLRAAYQHPESRVQNLKHAGLTLLLQAGWIGRLYLPQTDAWVIGTVAVLGVGEFLLPFLAESGTSADAAYHPHHISERYGLFTIIVLGEVILSVSNATRFSYDGNSLNAETVKIGLGGMIIVFSLWWIYFLIPFGDLLTKHSTRGFLWGYAHIGIHAPVASLAAGLAIIVQASILPETNKAVSRRAEAPTAGSEPKPYVNATDIRKTGIMIVAISTAIFIASLNSLLLVLTKFRWKSFLPKIATSAVLILIGAFCPGAGGLSAGDVVLLLCVPVLGLLLYCIGQVGVKSDVFELARTD